MATAVTADIINAIRPVKGLKQKIWVFNTGTATLTKTGNLINNLVKSGAGTSFTLEGTKDFADAGYSASVLPNLLTAFVHKLTFDAVLATAVEKANVDKADNIFVVVERNGLQTEGCFLAYGISNGLWKKAQDKMANSNNAVSKVSFESEAGMEEEYSEYVLWLTNYATTLALLVATES